MKKRLLTKLILLLICCVISLACGCGGNGHVHDFSMQVIIEQYKASNATYKDKAKYYYSCECGEKGSQTFEYGEIINCENHVEEWIVVKNPTCYEKGLKDNKCQICSKVLASEEIDKLTHNYIDNKCEYCLNVAVSNGLEFVKTQDGLGYALVGIGSAQAVNIRVPESYQGFPVIEVKDDALANLTSLKQLILPDTIKKIGYKAIYGCTALEKLTLPFVGENIDGQTNNHIGYIFGANNSDFNGYYVPNSLNEVKVTMANNISENAFRNCTQLKKVVLTDNIQYIYNNAFYNCSQLVSISIGNDVEYIGDSVFSGCSSLEYNQKDKLKYLGNDENPYLCLVGTENKTLKTAQIDGGCKYICSLAFANCQIENIEIPENVKIIAPSAFHNCSELAEITIPFVGERADASGITEFGVIFGQSSVGSRNEYVPNSLKKVVVNNCEIINKNAFSNCYNIEYITISESVKTIEESAFASCFLLKEFYMPNSVIELGDSIFSNCSSLQFVALSNKIMHLPAQTFASCSSLAEVGLSENLLSLGDYAFSNCTALWNVDITNNIKDLGLNTFYGCSNLVEITLGESVENVNPLAFEGCNMLKMIDVTPANPNFISLDGSLYSSNREKLVVYAKGKEDYSFSVPSSVKTIGAYAFCGAKFNNVIISEKVEFIEKGAFCNCINLRTIKFVGSFDWYYTINEEQYKLKTGGTKVDVSNLSNNISYFNNDVIRYWYKK